jgi:RNA polymerase sigma factor, sigma-70 family
MKEAILENNNLIYSIISKYTYYFDKDDLYQAAVLGLINAYKNYDKTSNAKFSSYAYFYIIGEVKKFIRESNTMKVSKELSKLNNVIIKAKEALSQKLGKEPSIEELSSFTGIDIDIINEIEVVTSITKSLDEEDEYSLYNYVSYTEQQYNEEILDLRNEIDNLNDFDRSLIENRYLKNLSQKETSKALGINQVKVSRKERDILVRLRTRLK